MPKEQRFRTAVTVTIQILMIIVAVVSVTFYRQEGELARLIREREIRFEMLGEVLRRHDIGYWEWNTDTNEVFWDDTLYDIFLVPRGQKETYESWVEAVHVHDRDHATRICSQCPVDGRPYTMAYRVTRQDGTIRYIIESGAYNEVTKNVLGVVAVYDDAQALLGHLDSMQRLAQPDNFMGPVPPVVQIGKALRHHLERLTPSGIPASLTP